MKKVINILAVIIGMLPFVVGGVLNKVMIVQSEHLLPMTMIGLVFCISWGIVAFVFQNKIGNVKRVVVLMNAIAGVDLLLLGIQELVVHAYWSNVIGMWSQLFYLPLIKIAFLFTRWSHTMFAAYIASFLLMVVISFLGCKISKSFRTDCVVSDSAGRSNLD